jgi:hypothetical protein
MSPGSQRLAIRDPEDHPKGVISVAYRNLSAHGVGAVVDCQKTFGDYPARLPKLGQRSHSKEERLYNDILRDFNSLVKSGEMLMVYEDLEGPLKYKCFCREG